MYESLQSWDKPSSTSAINGHQRFCLPSCGRFASRAAHMVSAWRSGGKCQLKCSQSVKQATQIVAKELEVTMMKFMGSKGKNCIPSAFNRIFFGMGWYFNPFQCPTCRQTNSLFLAGVTYHNFQRKIASQRCHRP